MFTVDVMVNITGLLGTCAANPAVPTVFGGSTWEINFNSTNLTFNSAALCPTSPAELGAPTCANPMAGVERCVSSNVSGNATTAQSAPTGSFCAYRLTFTANNALTTMMTMTQSGGVLGASTGTVILSPPCGPDDLPMAAPTGTTIMPTPVELQRFEVD